MNSSRVNWCFTINNYSEEDIQKLATINCQYIVFGWKTDESGGTSYLHGYVQMLKKCRITTAKKTISEKAHLHVTKRTPKEIADYCKKDGKYTEIGEMKIKGQRTDLRRRMMMMNRTAPKNTVSCANCGYVANDDINSTKNIL